MPFFSILIPMYNSSNSIRNTLDSIKKQRFTDYEVIVYDDGSSDGSYDIVDEYRKNNSRIKLYKHDKNLSILTTRIDLMKKAMGQYVLFLDSDDYYIETALEELHNVLKHEKYDMLRFGYNINSENKDILPKKTEDIVKDILTFDLKGAIWSNCYSSELIKKVLDNAEKEYCNMAEDTYLYLISIINSVNAGIYEKILYVYNYGDGISSSIKSLSYEKFLKDMHYVELMSDKIWKYIENNNKDYIKYLDKNRMMLYISVAAKYVFFDKNKENEKLYIEYLKKDKKYNDAISFINEQILPNKKY